MKLNIIYTEEMSHYDLVYKFEHVGDSVKGRYVGIIHNRGKYPQDYMLLQQKAGTVLIKLHAQLQDMIGVILRGDYVYIELGDIVKNENNPEQKFYKFIIKISVIGEENAKNENIPF